jgi:hypothetical protein
MRIDNGARGVARICTRQAGIPRCTDEDQEEIESSIKVLYAGRIAQLEFDSGYDDPQSWKDDCDWINGLVKDMGVGDAQRVKRSLFEESQNQVNRHWDLVKDLAEMLLSTPARVMTAEEGSTGWYKGMRNLQKGLSSEDICGFFLARGIQCRVFGDYSS